MAKKYLVEQFDEEEEKPKVAKEQGDGGLQAKDVDAAMTKKAEEPSEQSGQSDVIPNEPLEKAKALTEGVDDSSDKISKLEATVKDLSTKLEQLMADKDATKKEAMDTEEEPKIDKEEPKAENAIGFEGDTPSGPSLGSKSDIDGGLQKKAVDPQATAKAENPSTQSGQDMVIPTEPLEDVKKLNERLSGRRTMVGSYQTKGFTEAQEVENVMKEYARGNRV